ncbi:tetratricopeptide repeat protein [Ralstonia pseudosolanacearum]|uniref:YfgM family protein n=1 Tax=Ralstonia pseudosolanacearum TaxID=1310165 RepID=UPI001FFA47D3|nr:tetratricopeptide repeat protein [Ralstonia pseudosolanacearum]MDO3506813.1 tetratricopeptide repeat protein [Ralstonia pseudosolanacearum]MDO3511385.1 tetratricopeptide repeat protein [Ralstonia pseudosolanacearum]MDO3538392.1 tetratricopeptide repeat protein [Ralstonia pseudosolanacearum]MDO3563095.1 tetratricopeptide repeat protein [Ralstonia pseudosolanacearum]MDO3573202.1 tetratricopeptide repeat protein [Ralstonia pseudosolanacearum]
MAYDLEEQEQLESLKHWWRDNGNVVTWIVIVVLLALAGWFGWKNWQRKQAGEASVLYEQVQKAVDAKDAEKIKRAAADMEDKFGRTAYAQMGALSAAKALYEANDAAGAKAQLQWTIDHAGDDEYKAVAKLRLAGLLLDEKAYDQGLALVSGDVAPAFAALYADRRGDLLAAQNKKDEARTAYKLALEKLGQADASARQIVQFKLDALGGA